MCLGAALWSGVRRLVTGATKADATAVGFDEGPVFADSWSYVEARGIAVRRCVLRDEAASVLALYRDAGGAIYNA
jgi:tRNA(Arg) A34 adenosine deaminase TadA